ncbi:MAG TPA: hypothetical protein VHN80_30275, partial [Kineosporiaceae bacterium]|nr:hypothetical protein [Kineosporiaceae bacterium]
MRVLGCPALHDVDGGRVSGLRESALELLVYLVVHRDGATLDSITQDVYGATTRQRAAERLSTDVANLRNRIRHALDVGREVNPVVKARERYRLDPALLEVDWWQVQDACRRASAARTDLAAQVVALRRASALCGGVMAEGAAYD